MDIHTFVVDMRKAEAEADLQERWEHPLLRLLHDERSVETAEVWVGAALWLVHPTRQHRQQSGSVNSGWREGRSRVPLHHSDVMESHFRQACFPVLSQVSLTFKILLFYLGLEDDIKQKKNTDDIWKILLITHPFLTTSKLLTCGYTETQVSDIKGGRILSADGRWSHEAINVQKFYKKNEVCWWGEQQLRQSSEADNIHDNTLSPGPLPPMALLDKSQI